jgi:putative FmdB family regulatory protein
MPMYEYRCRSCEAVFERRLSFEERYRPQTCPGCGGADAALLMSVPAAVRGAASASSDAPVCPTTGDACGCGMPGLN